METTATVSAYETNCCTADGGIDGIELATCTVGPAGPVPAQIAGHVTSCAARGGVTTGRDGMPAAPIAVEDGKVVRDITVAEVTDAMTAEGAVASVLGAVDETITCAGPGVLNAGNGRDGGGTEAGAAAGTTPEYVLRGS